MKFGQWLGLISLIISLYIIWEIRELILLLFTAVIFATVLNRLVRYLERFKIKRNLAIVIIIAVIIPGSILFFSIVLPPFIDQFQKLIEQLPQVWETIRVELMKLSEERFEWLPAPPTVADLIVQIQSISTDLFRTFFEVFSNFLTVTLRVLLILTLTLMMLANPKIYRRTLLLLFPSFYRRRADEILSLSENAIVSWLGGIMINCLFIGTLSGFGLLVLQVRLVLAHALLAGVLNFIPNIGPATGVIFPIMIALIDAPWKIIPILIWYFIIQNVESYWLTPTVMAKQVSLLPAVTLFAQIFFTTIFGLFGLLLALPLTVVTKTWIDEVLFKDILDRWEQNI